MHPGGGDSFFKDAPLFKNDEQAEGSVFGDSSSSGFDIFNGKSPSSSKKRGSSTDFGSSAFSKPEDGSTEAEPTFLAPFSRTPPRKRQNQGHPPTPASPSAGGVAMFGGSDTASGNICSPLMEFSNIVPGQLLELSASFQHSQTLARSLSSPAQQNSGTPVKSDAAAGQGLNEMKSQPMYCGQLQGPGIDSSLQTSSVKEVPSSSKGFEQNHQLSMFGSNCETAEDVGMRKEELMRDARTPSGNFVGERNSGGGQSGGRVVAVDQGSHQAGEGQGLVNQLLVGILNLIVIQMFGQSGKAGAAPCPAVGSRVGEYHREGRQDGEGVGAGGGGREGVHGEVEGDEGALWWPSGSDIWLPWPEYKKVIQHQHFAL